jgi:hypothetical protein
MIERLGTRLLHQGVADALARLTAAAEREAARMN